MERSAEIEALTRRFFAAYREGRPEVPSSLMTDTGECVIVGTAPEEIWRGGRSLIEPILRAQMEEMGGSFPLTVTEVDAWSEGTVGWSLCQGFIETEVGDTLFRVTVVFHLEEAQWKIVHALMSVPVPNEEALGVTLTTSIDVLAQAVEVERPDLGSAAAPDGTVTLLFTDIEGSTERNAALGDQAWMTLLRRHHDLVRKQVAMHDGFEVKSMGDGFMLAFASARKALRCALDIQSATRNEAEFDIRIRAGLHAGEAVRVGDDFYGGVVNLAARVAGQAAGGEVFVSSLVKQLVDASGEFAFAAPHVVELKGVPTPQELFRVLA